MTPSTSRLALLITVIGFAVAYAAPVAAGEPPPATKWAWMVVRNATSTYDLAPGKDSGNSAGLTNHVIHAGTGLYGVAFDGVGGTPGTFLVSAFGSTPRVCLVSEYANNAGPAQAEIRCYNLAGVPADATFVVNWLTVSGSGFWPSEFGFGLNTSPTSNCGNPIEDFVTNGFIDTCPATNNVARWKFRTIGTKRGTVLVSAFARRPSDLGTSPGICDVVKFYPQPNESPELSDEWVDIRCFEMDGTPDIYRQHVVWYMNNHGMKGLDVTNVAYLLANRATATSYSPPAAKSFSTGGSITIERLGTGRYRVTLAGMPQGGSAQVSAFLGTETGKARVCTVASVSRDSTPTRIGVRCFSKTGNPVDTKFTLTYAR